MIAKNAVGKLVAIFAIICAAKAIADEKKLLPEIEPNEEGVYVQPWFYESFLDLTEDIEDSARENKQLVILWEQRGCPYCGEMHRVNLRHPKIVDYIRANFNVIQLNLWGDHKVKDLDGKVTTEKQLARKHRVQFTPTLQYLPKKLSENSRKTGHDVEVWRLLGYWKPFHFLNSFVYVREKGYKTEPDFQRWLRARTQKLKAEGKEVNLW